MIFPKSLGRDPSLLLQASGSLKSSLACISVVPFSASIFLSSVCLCTPGYGFMAHPTSVWPYLNLIVSDKMLFCTLIGTNFKTLTKLFLEDTCQTIIPCIQIFFRYIITSFGNEIIVVFPPMLIILIVLPHARRN